MSDYYNPSGHPPGTGQNSYAPPPRPQQYEGSQEYGSPAAQSLHGYRPSREDQYDYSPRSSGMQIGQYAGSEFEQGRQRRNSGPHAASQYRGTEASYYAPPSEYDDRPSSRGSRGSRREREASRGRGEKHGNHDGAKELGATLAGGAIAGWAGHELGHSNPLITVATALAGAYAGHKLEGKHEKDKAKKRPSQPQPQPQHSPKDSKIPQRKKKQEREQQR
ncbi:hypothetical protein LTS15_007477 [Exophiala xenobiotica]|nr:hypothetical protein LTS15_007477 [Exophiala xenobiotica]